MMNHSKGLMICVGMFACVDVVLRVLLYLSSHGGAVREEGGGGGMVGLWTA